MEESRIPIKLIHSNPEGRLRTGRQKAVGRRCRRGFEEDGHQGLAKKSQGEKRMVRCH
jgi:hypothetical protein